MSSRKALESAPAGTAHRGRPVLHVLLGVLLRERTGEERYLLNGRVNNLEYGSNAPGAPQVFIDDAQLKQLWTSPSGTICWLRNQPCRASRVSSAGRICTWLRESGGKFLYSNLPLSTARTPGMNSLPQSAQ